MLSSIYQALAAFHPVLPFAILAVALHVLDRALDKFGLDMFHERARQALRARFPTLTTPDVLALIGADRLKPRGRGESAERYAERLRAWRYPLGHRVRGSAYALAPSGGPDAGRVAD